MHALIIEDEPIIAILIEDLLLGLGYASVDFAVTEQDAVQAARAHDPDLVTADVGLADGCGIAAVEAIRAERDVPVVFVTATAGLVQERIADAVIVVKPFSPADLTQALHAAGPRILPAQG